MTPQEMMTAWVEKARRAHTALAGLEHGDCGHETCAESAKQINTGAAVIGGRLAEEFDAHGVPLAHAARVLAVVHDLFLAPLSALQLQGAVVSVPRLALVVSQNAVALHDLSVMGEDETAGEAA